LQKKLLETEPYTPSEDTFFLADYIKNARGQSALDIGTGSGYLSALLAKSFSMVVATDISFNVLKKQTDFTSNIICCNGADALDYKFDLVVCNLPYLNTDKILDVRTDGGKDGLIVPMKIISSVKSQVKPDGELIYITSSLSNFKKLIDYTRLQGFDVSIIARKKMFFEELILVKAIKLFS
jgi:release factor glutamine methyltransferase